MNDITQRLSELRELMKREHLSAFIFPSTDPHQGEYVPYHWKGREFISGFNGSAGTAVVTMHAAALWTHLPNRAPVDDDKRVKCLSGELCDNRAAVRGFQRFDIRRQFFKSPRPDRNLGSCMLNGNEF